LEASVLAGGDGGIDDFARAAVVTEATARATADTALAADITTLTATVASGDATNAAAITAEQTARANADTAEANLRIALAATVASGDATNAAAITSEASARASGDSALATRATNLEATVNSGANANATLRANLTTADAARVSGDTALATAVSSIIANSGANLIPDPGFTDFANFWYGDLVLATGGGPYQKYLYTRGAGNPYVFSQSRIKINPLQTYRLSFSIAADVGVPDGTNYVTVACYDINGNLISGDGTYWAYPYAASANINVDSYVDFGYGTAKPFPTNGVTFRIGFLLNFASTTGQVVLDKVSMQEITGQRYTNAQITTEQAARATADSALATSVTNLTTTVNGNTASINTQASSINGLNAKYGVNLNVNGHATGFVLNNGGGATDFVVTADAFKIVNPGVSNDAVFEVSGGVTRIVNAHIGTSNVLTNNVAPNAITQSVSAFTAGTEGISTTGYTTVQTVVITAAANDVVDLIANASADFTGGSNTSIRLRISRGGTSIFDAVGWTPQYVSPAFSDIPGAGTHTYTFEVAMVGALCSANISNRYLRALLTKR
jgi:hypothetical protein